MKSERIMGGGIKLDLAVLHTCDTKREAREKEKRGKKEYTVQAAHDITSLNGGLDYNLIVCVHQSWYLPHPHQKGQPVTCQHLTP